MLLPTTRTARTTTLIFSAPLGAMVLGSEMTRPPGCASGARGGANRSRSRPGNSLAGTAISATAACDDKSIATAASKRHNPWGDIPTPP
jgi:hypothetical protein